MKWCFVSLTTWVILFEHSTLSDCEAQSADLAERPNIVFLISDDQRPDTIHALGNKIIRTPNLDRLVKRGTTFTRATCAHPLCVPVRAEILTGCTGFKNGVHPPISQPDLNLATWPNTMRLAGYHTWWVGKWHIAGRPSTRGFADSLGLFSSGQRPPNPQYDYRSQEVTGYRGWMFQTDDRRLMPEHGYGLTPDISAQFADAAIEFIRRAPAEPFFLQVNFTAPHDPLLIPTSYKNAYDPASIPLPGNFLPRHPFDHGNYSGRDEKLLPWPRTPEAIRSDLAVYYAVISHLDEQVGRILDALDETGQRQNTIIIYSSDHGLALGSHGLMGKQNMYEHTINVPFILAGPGIPEGERQEAQCYLRDLFPTVCELTGVSIPESVQGKSLVPILHRQVSEVYPFIVGYFRDVQRMIRKGHWKFVRYPKINHEQLFDLNSDPLEMHSLIGTAEHQAKADELRVELSDWLRDHDDPLAAEVSQ